MLGNSMATNVLLRIMIPLTQLVRPDICAHDPWATGAAQDGLRKNARQEHIGDSAEKLHGSVQGIEHVAERSQQTPPATTSSANDT